MCWREAPYEHAQDSCHCRHGFVIVSSQELCALDLTSAVDPSLSGCIALSAPVKGAALHGSNAYVALGEAGVATVDLADPAAPALGERIKLPGLALDVAVGDDSVYVAAAGGGLVIMPL